MRHRLGRLIARTSNEVIGVYRNHEIHVARERNQRLPSEWYITVTAPSGEYAYDGWWGERGSTMQAAISQAIEGACLAKHQEADRG